MVLLRPGAGAGIVAFVAGVSVVNLYPVQEFGVAGRKPRTAGMGLEQQCAVLMADAVCLLLGVSVKGGIRVNELCVNPIN